MGRDTVFSRAHFILLCSHWEAYIEDLLIAAYSRFNSHLENPINHEEAQKRITHFSSPTPKNINEIFKKILNIDSVLSRIEWNLFPPTTVIESLEDIVNTRNDIAHGRYVGKDFEELTGYLSYFRINLTSYIIFECATRLHNAVVAHFQTNTEPDWQLQTTEIQWMLDPANLPLYSGDTLAPKPTLKKTLDLL